MGTFDLGELARDEVGRVLSAGLTNYERWLLLVRLPGEEGHNGSECWEWIGAITSSGHGSFRVRVRPGVWVTVSAHKFSYLHYHGPLPQHIKTRKDLHVRHSCDWRRCVAPNHLLPGTRHQNMQDMIERGRGRMQFGSPERAALMVRKKGTIECPF